MRPRSVGGNRLVQDYLQEIPSALQFLAGSPFRLASYRAKLAEVDSRFGPEERRAAATTFQPTSEAARARIDRFVSEGGVVVTTGQQAGYLTGPLYTIYKALSAAALAKFLEQRLGRVVLPVFWVASEDHDWEEVNHTYLLDPGGRLRRFGLESDDKRPLPMSQRVLEGDLLGITEEAYRFLGVSPETEAAVQGILSPFAIPNRPVSDAFREAMSTILGHFDMVIVDASDPALKEASKAFLRSALEEAEVQETAVAQRSRAIAEAGYPTQVSVLEDATNVFRTGERGRERLYRAGDDFWVRDRKGVIPRETILEELDSNPGSFSPNVLLRPVVESHVLPTLAYVGGPGEIAYFAQAGAVFKACGIAPPVAVPRFSATVVESAVERAMGKLQLSESDLGESREVLTDRLARSELPEDAMSTLASMRDQLVAGFDRLAQQVEDLDPTLIGSLGAVRNQLLFVAGRADRKILRAIKRRDSIGLARLDRVLNSLRPSGAPQDRVLNILPFLARYGDHFLMEIGRAIDQHWRLPDDE